MALEWETAQRAADRRRKAEARLAAGEPTVMRMSPEDVAGLVHELQVHQIELEMQNEELRQTQRDLEVNRARYWALYHEAPVGHLTLDRDGTIHEMNLTAAMLLGIERAASLGRRLSDFVRPDDAGAFSRYREAALAQKPGEKLGCDLRMNRSVGGVFIGHLESVVEPGSTDADGHFTRCYTVMTDISALRRTEEQLQESEARFCEIAERLEDVCYVRDRRGALSYVSPSFERIWGQPGEALIGKPSAWLDSVVPEDRDRVAAAWARMLLGDALSEIYRIRRPDGATRWVHSRAFPVLDSRRTVHHVVGVVRDITAERNLEGDLRQAQKMEAVGTLASGLGHNLRNTLHAMLSFIYVAQASTSEEQKAWALGRATETCQRGARVLDQLMAFARKREARPTLVPVNVDEAIRDAAALLEPMLGSHIVLAVETGAPYAAVMADVVELEQVLLNLGSNARDAMPHGGRLAIKTEAAVLDEETAAAHGVAKRPCVKIIVRDTGSGMDDETKARIFEPFFTTKDVDKGTGLGLSTVFGIVRRLGGTIDVASRKEEGTTFTVWLPSLPAGIPPDATS
jgi:PAS domain S-box-containing protein